MSELNKQLLGVIDKAFCGHAEGSIQKAANECEKICLQAQIDLLETVTADAYVSWAEIYVNGIGIENYIQDLQEQLKQLNQ